VSGLTVTHARRWEDARRQQLNLKKHHDETNIQNEIDDTVDDAVLQEERAHIEIAAFLEEEHIVSRRKLCHSLAVHKGCTYYLYYLASHCFHLEQYRYN